LESAEAAPDGDQTVHRLRAKHPCAERPIPAWVASFRDAALVLSIEHLRRAIFTAPRGSSGGPSGWVAEHFRDTFLAFPKALPTLLAVYQQWLRGDCAPAALPMLASSTLVALSKPNMDVRPIAIGERLALEPVLADGDVQLWSYADDTWLRTCSQHASARALST
ncbi:hypothetical protein CLOP_g738, partial [Closterium sp. NIES-67]